MIKKSQKKRIPKHLDFSLRAKYSALSESPTAWDFFKRWIQESRAFSLGERFIKYFRRFRFFTTAFRVAPWILLAISTHTLLYVMAIAAISLTPFILLGFLSLTGTIFTRHHSTNTRLASCLANKTVFVLFPLRGAEFKDGTFWRANALDLAKREGCAVIVVSPYLLFPLGISENGRFYLNVRDENKNLFLVRRHYFFSLKKNVLTRCVGRLILIY